MKDELALAFYEFFDLGDFALDFHAKACYNIENKRRHDSLTVRQKTPSELANYCSIRDAR